MRRLTSLFAALLLGSAAGVVFATGPATAAACAKGVGVTVVVGSSVACDANGGGAANNFGDTGHKLTYVQRQPGFVCQVDGTPTNSNCVNTPAADSYWGLFWSDGTSGTWKYASQGVGSLKVPAGGWVAFVFQNSETKKYPSMKPLAATAPKPKPTKPKPKPTSKPTTKTSPGVAKPSSAASTPTPTASTATPTPTASTKTPKPSATPHATPTAEQLEALPVTPEEAELAKASAADDDSGSGGLVWVTVGIGALLIAGMGMTLWRRKAAGGRS